MSFDYIRETYRVPAKRGGRVIVKRAGGAVIGGVITRATHYVWIRTDDRKFSRPFHPTDPALAYLDAEGAE